jgi:hypothetical protein
MGGGTHKVDAIATRAGRTVEHGLPSGYILLDETCRSSPPPSSPSTTSTLPVSAGRVPETASCFAGRAARDDALITMDWFHRYSAPQTLPNVNPRCRNAGTRRAVASTA